MVEGLHTAGSGMLSKAARQEAMANNLANAAVPGFKRDSLFLREMRQAVKRHSGDYPEWRINRIEGMWTDFTQGKLRHTGGGFDMALNGPGFFALSTPEGVQYTRNGSFSRSAEGLLVNALGYPVLDATGDEIHIPEPLASLVVDATGTVRGRDVQLGEDVVVGQLRIVEFPALDDPVARAGTPYQAPLSKSRDGLFIPHPATPQQPAQACEVVQGYLEAANVEPVLEMVRMIDMYRAYEADTRAIQVQDITLDRAVNEVGRVG